MNRNNGFNRPVPPTSGRSLLGMPKQMVPEFAPQPINPHQNHFPRFEQPEVDQKSWNSKNDFDDQNGFFDSQVPRVSVWFFS